MLVKIIHRKTVSWQPVFLLPRMFFLHVVRFIAVLFFRKMQEIWTLQRKIYSQVYQHDASIQGTKDLDRLARWVGRWTRSSLSRCCPAAIWDRRPCYLTNRLRDMPSISTRSLRRKSGHHSLTFARSPTHFTMWYPGSTGSDLYLLWLSTWRCILGEKYQQNERRLSKYSRDMQSSPTNGQATDWIHYSDEFHWSTRRWTQDWFGPTRTIIHVYKTHERNIPY